jgi:hypothetical protein
MVGLVMKTLPETFRRDDFDFEQLAREGMVVLFRKSKPEFANISYEVVVLHESADHLGPRGNLILAAECMPQNEKWGQEGWSYRDEDDAWAKFRGLVESRKGAPYAYPELTRGLGRVLRQEAYPSARA